MASIDAPAKINLTLEVLARRPDGYHGLRSVMIPIGLYDSLTWKPAPAFRFASNEAAVGNDNLVVRALAEIGLEDAAYAWTLEKRIPIGGGLGGGSSDAAAVLRAAMRGDFGPLRAVDWLAAARRLGSDVPFFLVEDGALVEGTGERVTPIGALPPWYAIVYTPAATVATADAYARLDAARESGYGARPRSDSESLRVVDALQRGHFEAVVAHAQNDFGDVIAAAYPPVERAIVELRAAGAPLVMLSGSGACVFGLVRNEDEANAVAARVRCGRDERCFIAPFVRSGAWRG